MRLASHAWKGLLGRRVPAVSSPAGVSDRVLGRVAHPIRPAKCTLGAGQLVGEEGWLWPPRHANCSPLQSGRREICTVQKRERPSGRHHPALFDSESPLADHVHPVKKGLPMTLAQGCAIPQQEMPDLLDAPLPQLLNALDVELVDSSITDVGFFGALVERRDGSRILSMPVGRSAFERDTAARMLLAEGLGLDAPPVPAPLAVSRA